jgi:hypothetical protein
MEAVKSAYAAQFLVVMTEDENVPYTNRMNWIELAQYIYCRSFV